MVGEAGLASSALSFTWPVLDAPLKKGHMDTLNETARGI